MICKKCKRDLPQSSFYKLRKNKPGLRSICKECQYNEIKEYRKTFEGKTSKALSNARRIAKENNKNLSHSFSVDEWRERVLGSNGFCPMCGNSVGILILTMDHAVPFCKAPSGFIYTIDDVQPLCPSCNDKKGRLILYFF